MVKMWKYTFFHLKAQRDEIYLFGINPLKSFPKHNLFKLSFQSWKLFSCQSGEFLTRDYLNFSILYLTRVKEFLKSSLAESCASMQLFMIMIVGLWLSLLLKWNEEGNFIQCLCQEPALKWGDQSIHWAPAIQDSVKLLWFWLNMHVKGNSELSMM